MHMETLDNMRLMYMTVLHMTYHLLRYMYYIFQMSIQRMPYPPHIKIDTADVILREVICTFAVIAFVIPLCIEANYASKEKFIGINVSI